MSVKERVDRLRAYVDVGSSSCAVVLDAPHDLWRAGVAVDTVVAHRAIDLLKWRTTSGTTLWQAYRLRLGSSETSLHGGDLRNDLATLLYIYVVMVVQVETFDELLVVQRSATHHRPRDEDRLHIGHRRDDT